MRQISVGVFAHLAQWWPGDERHDEGRRWRLCESTLLTSTQPRKAIMASDQSVDESFTLAEIRERVAELIVSF